MKVNALDSFAAGYKWCTAPANLTSEQSPPEPGNVPRDWGKALEDWGLAASFRSCSNRRHRWVRSDAFSPVRFRKIFWKSEKGATGS